MNAQGGTITGRGPVQVPIRLLALVVAAVLAAGIGVAAIQAVADDGAERLSVGRDESSQFGAVPVQRLYPDGFGGGGLTESMPVQRLYPEGFGGAALTELMPVQRLYPEGFGRR